MTPYSYADSLASALKVNWRIRDVLGDKTFDPSMSWLPASLSGTSGLAGLSAEDRRRLTHVEMAAYAHLFAYVEAFIGPTVASLAAEHGDEDRVAFDALTNFAAEEVKHMELFKAVRRRVDDALGFETQLLGRRAETARYVRSKSTGAVLLLTAVIEWFTQRHFQEAWRDDGSLSPLTKDIFRAHWQEEAQHAKMDHLEAVRAFGAMDEAERDRAVDDLIDLVGAVDGLLQEQTLLDLANFERHIGRRLGPQERTDVEREVLRAKRWTFIESGTTHPRFVELFLEVTTPAQQARVQQALASVLGAAKAA
jgi:hypothetical protein